MKEATFHPGMRVRLHEPNARGVRYFTLAYRRFNGWLAHTVDPAMGWYPQGMCEDVLRESDMAPVPTPWERYGRLPWARWWKSLAGLPLGWLLMHANRRYRTSGFYELKDQVLKAYGRPDGCDLQVLPPKPCWSCDATGKELTWNKEIGQRVPFADGRKCYDCNGTGEYAGKLYVRLVRRKLAWYVFHKPEGNAYDHAVAENLWSPKNRIEGLIKHHPHPKWVGYWCRIALKLLFDFPHFGPHFVKVTAQRAMWRVQHATEPLRRKLGWVLESDEDMLPF